MKTRINILPHSLFMAVVLVACLVVFGCQKDEKKIENPKHLVQQADKSFELDSLTSYGYLMGKLVDIDGKMNLVYYNRTQTSFYFNDYQTGKLKNVIKLSAEGPNSVPTQVMSYYLHNKDSIFINSRLSNDKLYIVDGEGKVIYKKPPFEKRESNEKRPLVNTKNFNFNDATFYKNQLLQTGLDIYRTEQRQSNPLRVSFNLTTNEIEDLYLEKSRILPNYKDYAKMSAMKRGLNINSTILGKQNQLFASSQISDSIFEFNNGQYVKAYYAGKPKIKLGDYKSLYESTHFIPIEVNGRKGIKAVENPERLPYFGRMIMDIEEKWIYRFLIESTYLEADKGNDYRRVMVKEASIVAFNTKTKKSYNFKFPEKLDLNMFLHQIFANKNGIHFPILDQEKENEKRYNVFKIE